MSASLEATGFGKIEHQASLRDMVEQRLAAAIVTGDMEPGRVFSAPTLAAEFGVSVTPVREAMMSLEKRGFVTTLRNKGFRVSEVRQEDLDEIVEVRRLLEPPSMRRLAARYPESEHARFRALATRSIEAARSGDLWEYITADSEFHLGLLALLGNDRLTKIVGDLRSQTRIVGLSGLRSTDALVASTTEHSDLLDLLEAGDGRGAERLMLKHVGHVMGQWSGNPEPAKA